MKKNVIAVLLSVVLAAGSIGTAPVLAAEVTAEEAVSLQQEESTEVQEEASELAEDVETGSVSEEIPEETADEEETIREIEEPGQNTESPTYEAEETTEAEEEEIAKQDESSDTASTEELMGDNEENIESLAGEENTTGDTATTEEVAVIEEEVEAAEENDALLAEDEKIDESGTCGDKATWTLKGIDRNLTLTISGSGEMYDYEENQDHAAPWYLNKGRIDNVIIEDGITGIGNYAFYNCGNLADITIPDSVTRIGKGAFKKCSHLESIEIPHGVTCLEESVFQYSGLTGITIPNSVTKIEAYAIYNCNGLTSITIPDNVTRIDNYAIFACYSLTSITISDSVTYIGNKGLGEGAQKVDVYTIKDCAADRFFRFLDNGSSQIITMHYPCEQLGHKFGDWTITKDATCTEAGSKERECTRCYEIETEVIPATGHTWAKDYTVDKEPTQTEAGSESIHCTVCDAINKSSVRVIPKLGFSVDAEFVLEKPAFNYTGRPIEPGVTVTYNGKELIRDKDFKVTYGNNIDLGQADVDVTGIGKYTGTEHLHFTIRIGAPKKVTCTNVASGMKVSWTKVNGATRYKVYRDGKYIFTTSALEVTDKEVKYKGGTKYVYKVVATEKRFGDSEFYKTGTCYRLMPVGIKSLTNPSAGKMTVTYDKSAGCYGYVVRYGLKADMSDARVVTVQGQNTTSRTFGGMKKGKTYFVQVRTYKLDNGVRYYSGYCTTKMIKIVK